MKKFQIHDTTLRDGEQMPGVVFSYDEKLMLAKSSIEFGTDFIDIMPSVSEMEEKLTADLASRHKKNISATCRMKKEEIDAAARCGVKQIVLFAALSDIHLIHKRRITRQENLEQSLSMIRYAKDCGLVVDFAGEDCTRAQWDYLKGFLEAISLDIRIFYAADTVGYMSPESTHEFISKLKCVHRDIGVHMHNDMGLATANTLSALQAGATCFSGTFTGIGERAGNAPLEEVVVGLRSLYNVDMDVNYSDISKICAIVSKCSGVDLQMHKPIVGKNAFCHESGIHADGVIKFPATYEYIEPESVGRARSFYFGKHTGKNVLRHFLPDIDEVSLDGVLAMIKESAQASKCSFSEDEIMEIAEQFLAVKNKC